MTHQFPTFRIIFKIQRFVQLIHVMCNGEKWKEYNLLEIADSPTTYYEFELDISAIKELHTLHFRLLGVCNHRYDTQIVGTIYLMIDRTLIHVFKIREDVNIGAFTVDTEILTSRKIIEAYASSMMKQIQYLGFLGSYLTFARYAYFEANLKALHLMDITLFYGTTRNKTSNSELNNFYGSEVSDVEDISDLRLGLCKVSIPPNHKQGNLERPRKLLWWDFSENKDKHVVLTSIEEKEHSIFYKLLKDKIVESNEKDALIFIHGFNTSFSEAAWRAAQITYDLPFNNGISGFFSWCSKGNKLFYGKDIEAADASVPAFTKFIEDIIELTGIERIHFIAHSMGNRVLTGALNELSKNEIVKTKLKAISQIILAAPDLDYKVFKKVVLPRLIGLGERRTLYVSVKDKALRVSKKFRNGQSRIGLGGRKIFIADGIDTIDASSISTKGNHHSYMFENAELLYDLNLLICNGFEPYKRRLQECFKGDLRFWRFRK